MRRVALVLLMLIAAACASSPTRSAPTAAQSGGTLLPPSDSYAARALRRWAIRIAADSGLQLTLRQAAAANPASAFDPRAFRSLDDATLLIFAAVIYATFRQAPATECVRFLGSAARPSLAFLATVDSGLVDSWLRLFDRMVYAQATSGPELPVASPSDIGALMREIQAQMNPQERRRIERLARANTPEAVCEGGLLIFGYLARLPPARAGPLMRAAFTGKQ